MIPGPAQLEGQHSDASAAREPGMIFFAASLYLHVSLFFGIVKLGLTTNAGGPRESGQHAKVFFPVIHKAVFGVKLYCSSQEVAAKLIKRYEDLAFRILSKFILCGEVC